MGSVAVFGDWRGVLEAMGSWMELGVKLGIGMLEADVEYARDGVDGDSGGTWWDEPEDGEVGDEVADSVLDGGNPPPGSSPIATVAASPSIAGFLDATRRVPVPNVGNTANDPAWSLTSQTYPGENIPSTVAPKVDLSCSRSPKLLLMVVCRGTDILSS